jgi:hypothetical protein
MEKQKEKLKKSMNETRLCSLEFSDSRVVSKRKESKNLREKKRLQKNE